MCLYFCDPRKNKECQKINCFINDGECCKTTHKEYRIMPKKGYQKRRKTIMKKRKQTPIGVRDTIQLMYDEGMTIKEICQRMNVPYYVAYNATHRNIGPARYTIPKEERLIRQPIDEVQKMKIDILYYQYTYNMSAISRKLNIPYHQVHYYLSPAIKNATERWRKRNPERSKEVSRRACIKYRNRKKAMYKKFKGE